MKKRIKNPVRIAEWLLTALANRKDNRAIIGVVKNAQLNSLRFNVRPVVYHLSQTFREQSIESQYRAELRISGILKCIC